MAMRLISGVIPEGDMPKFLHEGVKRDIVQLDDVQQAGALLRSGLHVGKITPLVLQSLKDMGKTLLETVNPASGKAGFAIAHNQIRGNLNLVVIDARREELEVEDSDTPKGLLALINPQILTYSEERASYEEKCLSILDLPVPVIRPVRIAIGFQDILGDYHEMEWRNLFARVGQHELDHLGGMTILDHMDSAAKDDLLLKALKMAESRATTGRFTLTNRASLTTMLTTGQLTIEGLRGLMPQPESAVPA